jgi:hypothetical protein
MAVRTDPPEALVYLNGVEVGRTPLKRDFIWYGTYDVQVRKEGYQTLKTRGYVTKPWWQYVPIDLAAELLPMRFRDQQLLTFTLRPTPALAENPKDMLRRAELMEPMLESSEYTRPPPSPTTAAATKPASRG